MIISTLYYLLYCGITILLIQKISSTKNRISFDRACFLSTQKSQIIMLTLSAFMIIFMYGLRYGIGTDYFQYEKYYYLFRKTSISDYWKYHINNEYYFYMEPGFYLLNKIVPSFRMLLFIEAFLMNIPIFYVLVNYSDRINISFAYFIYFCIQFIYSMNCVRFSITLVLLFVSYFYLLNKEYKKYIFIVIIATLFHKTAIISIVFLLLNNFSNKKINILRDLLLVCSIIFFVPVSKLFIIVLSHVGMFERYFSTTRYSLGNYYFSFVWMFHILPVVCPLIAIFFVEKIRDMDIKYLFRIYILEIPFRMLGGLNSDLTRLSRISQITEMLLVPLCIFRIRNKKVKIMVYIYYIGWYIFNFVYYAIVNDAGDSLPYISIINLL